MKKDLVGSDPTKPVGKRNPPKATQFGQPHGNKTRHGLWKPEDSPRYKLERMIQLNKTEIQTLSANEGAPLFERKLADAILNADWNTLERIINQVYGAPTQKIEQTISPPIPLLNLDEVKQRAKQLRAQE